VFTLIQIAGFVHLVSDISAVHKLHFGSVMMVFLSTPKDEDEKPTDHEVKPCLETEGVPEAEGMDNVELEVKQEQHPMRHCVEAMAPERRAEPKLEVMAAVKREVKLERNAVQQPDLGAKGVKREIVEQTGVVQRLVRPGSYRSALSKLPAQTSWSIFTVLVVRCQSDLQALAPPPPHV
jgi:hypothetical protein